METRFQQMTDDQAIAMMRDFIKSQEKLQEQREIAVKTDGVHPHYSHYTSAKTIVDKFKALFIS